MKDRAAVPEGFTTGVWRLRRVAFFALDAALLSLAFVLTTLARYDGEWSAVDHAGLVRSITTAVVSYAVASSVLRLHVGRYAIGTADELVPLAGVLLAVASTTTFAVMVAGSPRWSPLSVPALAAMVAFVLFLGLRLWRRRTNEGFVRPSAGERTLVFGAGEGGSQLVRSMLRDPRSPFLPVGLIDDDPRRRHARVHGVRLIGGRDEIARAAHDCDASHLVIAVPSADAALVREISATAAAAGLTVKVLPRLAELIGQRVGIRDVRDINLADLLGRREIDTNVAAIAGYLVGKRVLITGAGGSIGSELCAQVARYRPAELIMLDRDESALHAVQLALHGEARLDSPEVVLADIRDSETLTALFRERRPDVVFHAAALKHVTMLEQYPDEAWKTNVLGTRNVLEAARLAGVTHLINVSTDKAADPVNVLGRSKRTAERLTARYAELTGAPWVSVRFGNVLGSRGSVLETFAAQVRRGGPVTVTDPEVTRYFMTVTEAVQLVIQAGSMGLGGALVLDMGSPVRIADVATQLVAMTDRRIPIVFTGLRPGEKLHEELFSAAEAGAPSAHPLISHVAVPPLEDWALARLGRRAGDLLDPALVAADAASWPATVDSA